MTGDTTFKEFVEEKGLNLSLLDLGSRNYKNLIKAFNEEKRQLKAEETARKYEGTWARIELNRQSAAMDAYGRGGGRPKDVSLDLSHG